MAKSKKQRKAGRVKARGWGFVLLLFDDHNDLNCTRVHMTLKGAKSDAQGTVLSMMGGVESEDEVEKLEWVKKDGTEWQCYFGGGQGTWVIHKTKIYE